MSEYYTIYEEYGQTFYQVPKVFFTNDLYKKGLTDTEKIAFGMLKDRFELSKKNKWYDDKGRIYFIFSQIALMEIFDCSNKTASNIKKKLVQLNLLEIRKRGQGQTDLLYLKKPIVTDNDIYKIKKEEDRTEPEEKKEDVQTLGGVETCKNYTSRNEENTRLEMKKIHTNDTDLKETDFKDTEKNLNPNPNEVDINKIVDAAKIPDSLKNRIKFKIGYNFFSLSPNQIFEIEEAYAYQIQKNYVIPDCDFDYSGALNDVEFAKTVVKMLETVKKIDNMRGLIKEWVMLAFEYKNEQLN